MRLLGTSTNVGDDAGQRLKRWLWAMAASLQFRWPRAFPIVPYETGLKNFRATTLCPVVASEEVVAVENPLNSLSTI